MANMIFLLGHSASGKDSVLHELINLDPLYFIPIIQYTTRPKRVSEMDGVEYHFVSSSEYNSDLLTGSIATKQSYFVGVNEKDPWVYYTKKEDIKVNPNKCYVIQGPLEMYEEYKKIFEGVIKPVFLYASSDTLIKRSIRRLESGKIREYDILEIFRRIRSDSMLMPLHTIRDQKIPVVVNEEKPLKKVTEEVLTACGYDRYADLVQMKCKEKSIVDAISDILCVVESGAREERDDSIAELMPMARYLLKHLDGDKILKMAEYYNKQQNKNN